jgi:hypothetical protein
MLFLLNDRVLEVEMPEVRLSKCWRRLGCGEPGAMRAREAVEFARAVLDQARHDEIEPELDTLTDLAALIIAKTGANGAQFQPRASGPSEVRLSQFDERVLESFICAGGAGDAWISVA